MLHKCVQLKKLVLYGDVYSASKEGVPVSNKVVCVNSGRLNVDFFFCVAVIDKGLGRLCCVVFHTVVFSTTCVTHFGWCE